MAEIVGIKFKDVGKVYYFGPNGMTFQKGDKAIVETARGLECGEVATENSDVPDESIVAPLKPVIRHATKEDLATVEQNKEKEKKGFPNLRRKNCPSRT